MPFCSSLSAYFWPKNCRIYIHECFIFSKETLLAIRMFLFLFSFGIYSMSNINRGTFYKDYMYLTYWGEVLTMSTFLTLLIDNILQFQGYYKDLQYEESKFSRVAHILFEIAFSYELSIVLLFWGAVYSSETDVKNSFYYTINVLVHGMCLLSLWIENCVNFIEFFPRHMIIVILVGIAYIIDNVIVVFCINFNVVYSVLTWTDWPSYIYVLLCLLVALFHFYIGMTLFRKHKWKKWGSSFEKGDNKGENSRVVMSPLVLELEKANLNEK